MAIVFRVLHLEIKKMAKMYACYIMRQIPYAQLGCYKSYFLIEFQVAGIIIISTSKLNMDHSSLLIRSISLGPLLKPLE